MSRHTAIARRFISIMFSRSMQLQFRQCDVERLPFLRSGAARKAISISALGALANRCPSLASIRCLRVLIHRYLLVPTSNTIQAQQQHVRPCSLIQLLPQSPALQRSRPNSPTPHHRITFHLIATVQFLLHSIFHVPGP